MPPYATCTLSGHRVPTLPASPQYTPKPPDGLSTPIHPLVCYHCHFATDHLHKYVQFTIYGL